MSCVLIVDDDRDLTDALKDLLEVQGHNVVIAGTGAEALQVLIENRFDLVMLDWQLPDTDGLNICRQYRNKGGKSQILMLTGMRDPEFRESGKAAGADEFLTKPFTVDQLLERAKALLGRAAHN